MKIHAALFSAVLLLTGGRLNADQIEMQNGDHYSGRVISMTAEAVVLQNEVLGKVTLPRAKVANITLGSAAAPAAAHPTNQTASPTATLTNANPDIAAALHNLGANTNFVEQVRKQFLSEAGPEANNKYDELVGKMFSGKFDMNSLRAEAKTAADQIRALKKQGGDVGETMNSYLAILDNFLKESANATTPTPTPLPPATTNSPGIIIIR